LKPSAIFYNPPRRPAGTLPAEVNDMNTITPYLLYEDLGGALD